MKQSFRLIVRIAGYACTVQAHKVTTTSSVNFFILNDSLDLLDKTGVQVATFQYDNQDNRYHKPRVSYHTQTPELKMPNFSFENAIAESIKRYEGVYKHTAPAELWDRSTLL